VIDSVAAALIAVFSLVLGQVLQYVLELRKRRAQLKDYPSRILYDRQLQFIDAAAPVLVEVNTYLNRVQAWLGVGTMDRAQQEADYNDCIAKLFGLIETHQNYLPAELLMAVEELTKHCMLLQTVGGLTLEQVDRARDQAFTLQNKIRRFVGIDAVSAELIRALDESRPRR